jgi:hypothetical protein
MTTVIPFKQDADFAAHNDHATSEEKAVIELYKSFLGM